MVKLLMISQPRKRTCLRLIYLVLLVMAILFGASLLWNKRWVEFYFKWFI